MKILVAFLVLSLSSVAQAQVTSTNESKPNETADSANSTNFWLMAGPGFSKVTTNASSDGSSNRTAIAVGAELEIPMDQSFSIQTGVDYLQKGFEVSGSGGTGTLAINYLELPLLLKVKVPVRDSRFTFAAGPYAALAVKRETRFEGAGQSASNSADEVINQADFGARFGAAFEIPVQDRLSISIGANYDLGLRDISSNNSGSDKSSNRTFMAMVGLGFKI